MRDVCFLVMIFDYICSNLGTQNYNAVNYVKNKRNKKCAKTFLNECNVVDEGLDSLPNMSVSCICSYHLRCVVRCLRS